MIHIIFYLISFIIGFLAYQLINIDNFTVGCPPKPPAPSGRVLWGIAPGINSIPTDDVENKEIPISKIIDDLDVIWDWQAGYNNWEEGKEKIYDISFKDAKDNTNLAKNKNVLAKYIPMQWGPAKDAPDKVVEYLKLVKDNPQNNLPKYALSWNEPDMTGTILPDIATGKGGTGSSSAGFWFSNTFVYGNAGEDLTELPQINTGSASCTYDKTGYDKTSFVKLSSLLIDESKSYRAIIPTIQITTPVTATGLFLDDENKCLGVKAFKKGEQTIFCNGTKVIGQYASTIQLPDTDFIEDNYLLSQPCGGIWGEGDANTRQKCLHECGFEDPEDYRCNGFPIIKKDGECKSQCGEDDKGKWRNCMCNGWLNLLKNADINNWNSSFNIINIHAYHYFAHIVKLKILATILVFKDDIDKGKKIWLTETACIYRSGKFITQLFWNETGIKDCKDNVADATTVADSYQTSMNKHNSNTRVKIPNKLPGLRETRKFNFLGKNGTWFDHGFGAVTYFTSCIPAWKEDGFPDNIKLSDLCDSRIFKADKTTNDVWKILNSPPPS